jgi:hypothetical protein
MALRVWIDGLGDQRQAPVAAETQRRMMRLRISLVTCWSFGLIGNPRQNNLRRQISAAAPPAVNEMGIHICRRDAVAFLPSRENGEQIDFRASIARLRTIHRR